MDIGRSFGMSLTGWDSLFGSLESEHSKRRVEVIEALLNESRCVIVLWSEMSLKSKYVRAEAAEALDQDKLVPVAI